MKSDVRIIHEIGDYFPTQEMNEEQKKQYESQVNTVEKQRMINETKEDN